MNYYVFFYIILLFISIPMPKIVAILRKRKAVKSWAKVSYRIIIAFVIIISAVIIFVNIQYYSVTILTYLDIHLGYAFICNVVGLFMCMMMWSEFIDEIVYASLFIENKLKNLGRPK